MPTENNFDSSMEKCRFSTKRDSRDCIIGHKNSIIANGPMWKSSSLSTAVVRSTWMVLLLILSKHVAAESSSSLTRQSMKHDELSLWAPTRREMRDMIMAAKTESFPKLAISENQRLRRLTKSKVAFGEGEEDDDDDYSPYETLWPGYKLPPWANKRTSHPNEKEREEEEVCFVHVGKAGGSSVGCDLGFSLHCHGNDNVRSEGLLAEATHHIFHKDVYDCRDDATSHFLFVIRDPIDRARSAFYYDRPYLELGGDGGANNNNNMRKRVKNYYVDCFYTLEELAQRGLSSPPSDDDGGDGSFSEDEIMDAKCRDMAIQSLQGTDEELYYPSHLYYNYQYYFEAVPDNAPIFVIRNEHLLDDWNSIETFLGGDESSMISSVPMYNINADTSEEDKFLSEESVVFLCKMLCNEIQVYKKILRLAMNLEDEQVQVSLEELSAKCPEESAVESCEEPLPDIRKKLRENRGYLSADIESEDNEEQ